MNSVDSFVVAANSQKDALDSVRLSKNVSQQDGKCEAVRIIALQRFIRHSHNNISRYLRWKDLKTLSEVYSQPPKRNTIIILTITTTRLVI
jgi:hypothetical protein